MRLPVMIMRYVSIYSVHIHKYTPLVRLTSDEIYSQNSAPTVLQDEDNNNAAPFWISRWSTGYHTCWKIGHRSNMRTFHPQVVSHVPKSCVRQTSIDFLSRVWTAFAEGEPTHQTWLMEDEAQGMIGLASTEGSWNEDLDQCMQISMLITSTHFQESAPTYDQSF